MNDFTPTLAAQLRTAAADIASEHEDGADHYLHNGSKWRPISRASYDALVEIGVDVRLMRVER